MTRKYLVGPDDAVITVRATSGKRVALYLTELECRGLASVLRENGELELAEEILQAGESAYRKAEARES